MARRIFGAAFAVTIVGLSACIDKPAPTQAAAVGARAVRLQLVTVQRQVLTASRTVDVDVGYQERDGEHISLATQSVSAVPGSTTQLSISVDLTNCLADTLREGSKVGCPLRVAVALRDSAFVALDSVEVGPLDVSRGQTPQIPPIDLAVERFAVTQWVGDEALRLGGAAPFSPSAVGAGYVAGTAPPILYTAGLLSGSATLEIFQNGKWQHVSGPTSSLFYGLAVVSPTEVWIAGDAGLFRYDGTSIAPIAAVRDSLLSVAVLNTGGNGRLIVAGGRSGVLWQGDGTTWKKIPLGTAEQLSDVCVTAPNEAFAAGETSIGGGGTGTMWHYDGTSWSSTQSAAPQAKIELLCPSPGQAYVIANSVASLKWNGSSWQGYQWITGFGGGRLLNWGMVSPTELYAFGDSTDSRAFYSANGTTGREVGRTSFMQAFSKLWADPRGGAAYHVGSFGRVTQVTPSGYQVLGYSPSVRDAIATSPASAFAVGWNLFLARWNGTAWTVDRPPTGTPTVRILHGVWSDGPSNAWTAGGGSTILRWNGTAWSVVSDINRPIAQADNYNAVWGQGSVVLIAGDASILRCTSPTSCARDNVPGAGPLYGIWGTAANNVFAVGLGGRIVRYNGSAWTLMTSATTHALSRVWGSSGSDVWAFGDSTLVHFDGTAWSNVPMTGALAAVRSSVPSPQQGVFELGLWGSSPKDVYVAGDNGSIARFDGTSWITMASSTLHRIVSITGVAGFGAFAIAENQSTVPGSTLMRGVGPSGGFGTPMIPPTVWP